MFVPPTKVTSPRGRSPNTTYLRIRLWRLLNLSRERHLRGGARWFPGKRSILRVHRKNYPPPATRIESETRLARRHCRTRTAEINRTRRASCAETVGASSPSTTTERRATSCISRWWPGWKPDEQHLTGRGLPHVGAPSTATLHEPRGRRGPRPRPGLGPEFSWDWEHSLGDHPAAGGRWQGRHRKLASRRRSRSAGAAQLLEKRLAEYGSGPERFGLVARRSTCDQLARRRDRPSRSSTSMTADSVGTSTHFRRAAGVLPRRRTRRLPDWQDSWLAGLPAAAARSAPGGPKTCWRRSCCCARLLLAGLDGNATAIARNPRTKAITFAEGQLQRSPSASYPRFQRPHSWHDQRTKNMFSSPTR